jgi:competence protein ComEA
MKNALYVLFGVIAGFILAGVLFYVSRAPAGEAIVLQPAPTEAPIVIHIIGGVTHPGLYHLPEGARVQDVIDAAGGLLTTADVATMNLAARVEDGQQVNIPCKDNACPVGEEVVELPGGENVTPQETSGENANTELVDVNLASQEELETLTGIGPSIAQKIVEYREANGPFIIVEDLLNVEGIGPATLDEIRDEIMTGYE